MGQTRLTGKAERLAASERENGPNSTDRKAETGRGSLPRPVGPLRTGQKRETLRTVYLTGAEVTACDVDVAATVRRISKPTRAVLEIDRAPAVEVVPV